MEREQRAMILLEQEEAQSEVNRLRDELRNYGSFFSSIATYLKTDPERIVFSDAPNDLGVIPIALSGTQSVFNWNTLPRWEVIAQKVQELRRQEKRLLDTKIKLTPMAS